jgi:hypothetical protein
VELQPLIDGISQREKRLANPAFSPCENTFARKQQSIAQKTLSGIAVLVERVIAKEL